jgi:diguanylate cyclase (GGDEF)-like protein
VKSIPSLTRTEMRAARLHDAAEKSDEPRALQAGGKEFSSGRSAAVIVTRDGKSASHDLHLAPPASQYLRNFIAPVGILALALLLTEHLSSVPVPLRALLSYGPPIVLIAGMLVSLSFKRGRALFAMLSLSAAYLAYHFQLQFGLDSFESRTVFAAICLFVPFNIVVYSLIQERGALNSYGIRRIALILLECIFVFATIVDDRAALTDALYYPLFSDTGFWDARIPHIALLVFGGALIAITTIGIIRNSVVDAAFSGAIVAFAVACNAMSSPDGFAVYIMAAGGMIAVAVLQDSYRMAFHDDLTGLPGRRALNERLLSLSGQYTIAMVDVDHFKAFNDKWGHDVGDQVLKLVASRLGYPGRGGEAFRYGGEEFTLVFPGRRLEEVLPRLETLRRDIEGYRFLMRDAERSDKEDGKARAEASFSYATRTLVSVTVSIGAAERSDRVMTTDDVLKAADKALYRAKEAGRNRVST